MPRLLTDGSVRFFLDQVARGLHAPDEPDCATRAQPGGRGRRRINRPPSRAVGPAQEFPAAGFGRPRFAKVGEKVRVLEINTLVTCKVGQRRTGAAFGAGSFWGASLPTLARAILLGVSGCVMSIPAVMRRGIVSRIGPRASRPRACAGRGGAENNQASADFTSPRLACSSNSKRRLKNRQFHFPPQRPRPYE